MGKKTTQKVGPSLRGAVHRVGRDAPKDTSDAGSWLTLMTEATFDLIECL